MAVRCLLCRLDLLGLREDEVVCEDVGGEGDDGDSETSFSPRPSRFSSLSTSSLLPNIYMWVRGLIRISSWAVDTLRPTPNWPSPA